MMNLSKLFTNSTPLIKNIKPLTSRRFYATESTPTSTKPIESEATESKKETEDASSNKIDIKRDHHHRDRNALGHRRRDFSNNWNSSLSPFSRNFDPMGLERMFNRFGDDFFPAKSLMDPFSFSKDAQEMANWKPHADMYTTKDGYELTAELPGVSKDHVKIEINDDVITLKGEKKSEVNKDERDGPSYYERSYGSFVRRFQLPEGVDPKTVKAEFKDGVLKMKIPKKNITPAHEVKID